MASSMARIKLTGYRLAITVITLTLGIWKAFAASKHQHIVSGTLDWVIGITLAVLFFWLGVYETNASPKLAWFYEADYAQIIVSLTCIALALSTSLVTMYLTLLIAQFVPACIPQFMFLFGMVALALLIGFFQIYAWGISLALEAPSFAAFKKSTRLRLKVWLCIWYFAPWIVIIALPAKHLKPVILPLLRPPFLLAHSICHGR